MTMLNFSSTLFRLLLSFILSGLLGWEREKKGKRPGLRTHILVGIGSTLITLVSIYISDTYQGKIPVDPARIAAGIITGIGFLCAGAIIRNPEGIIGLTTAASVWVNAAIGLAVGCGYISGAVITTALAFFTLFFIKREEKKIEKSNS